MTIEEIFGRISQHMIRGMMTHDQLASYYDFLGLRGYKRCHEYHYFSQSCAYRGLQRYFINHYSKLIPEMQVDSYSIIPASWFKYTRQDVDATTKRNAVKNGLQLWISWEKETKKLYEEMYKQAMNINEVAGALKIAELICDVDCELKKAERYQLNKMAIDYDMTEIIAQQDHKHKKYKEKMEQQLGVKIC